MLRKHLMNAVLVACLMSLSGCATTPVSIKDAKQISKDRLLAFQTQDAKTTATIIVIRDEGLLGSGCYYGLWINQTLAARVDVAELATFFVEPGEILLRVGRDPQGRGLCGTELDNWTQRETIMRPGDRKTFRMTSDENAKLDIFRSDIDQTKN